MSRFVRVTSVNYLCIEKMDDMMTSTRCLQLRAVQSSVVAERVGDFGIATDRNAAARQSASIILFVFTLQLK